MKDVSKRFCKTAAAFLLSAAACLLAANDARACTAVYVGKDVSADGTTILAKSNDNQCVWPNYIDVVKRVQKKKGRKMPVDAGRTVFAEIPETTYKYVSTPWMDSTTAMNSLPHDAAICANEMGVVMLMSITSLSNDDALAADPLVKNGLTECAAVDLVVCQSASAREAVKVLCSIIDEYGSAEINIALIADQKEAWYVDMYTGRQYAAVKLPADKVCVFGNEFALEYLSDYEESIVSADLQSLPERKGFAAYGKNGELNLFKTYSGLSTFEVYSHMRTWIGHQILSPSVYGADYDKDALYPLCFSPDKKIGVQDVMEILRNRYEGTKYSPDETGRDDMRVIGTDMVMSVHVAQVFHDVPADMSCVVWECPGPALYGVFVPISNASLRAGAAYARNQAASEAGIFDTDNYPYFRIKELCTLSVEQDSWKAYGQPVRAYWHEAEAGMTSAMAAVVKNAGSMKDKKAAKRYISDYCAAMQDKAFYDAGKLLNQVRWNKSKNSNTLKNARDPVTREIIENLNPIEPIKVELDSSFYKEVPQAPAGGIPFAALLLLFVALDVFATAWFLSRRAKKDGK